MQVNRHTVTTIVVIRLGGIDRVATGVASDEDSDTLVGQLR